MSRFHRRLDAGRRRVWRAMKKMEEIPLKARRFRPRDIDFLRSKIAGEGLLHIAHSRRWRAPYRRRPPSLALKPAKTISHLKVFNRFIVP